MGRNNPAEAKGKTERQQTILRLIQEHPISRQEVLLEHLRQEGFEVTQATISRDIRELCLVKAATADGYRYVSSHNESLNPKMQGRFETIFHESVLSDEVNSELDVKWSEMKSYDEGGSGYLFLMLLAAMLALACFNIWRKVRRKTRNMY